jgi:hypothetical protein
MKKITTFLEDFWFWILITFIVSAVIFTFVMVLAVLYLQFFGDCKYMKSWSVTDLPVRCLQEYK